MTLLIQAANIEYAYGGNDVFSGVTFEIRKGDRLALIGANGSGKSTLFRLMAGQLRRSAAGSSSWSMASRAITRAASPGTTSTAGRAASWPSARRRLRRRHGEDAATSDRCRRRFERVPTHET